nr:uncharacterized protein I203_04887 [Kwoniella mangroviensis CBS 8507]OCF65867.1 hypothetical protein I203_04887 [Kwoniella mangroviensis CBS 8507]
MFLEIASFLGLLSYVWADVYIGCFTPQAPEDMNLQWQIIQASQSCRALCAAQSLQYTFEYDTINAIGVIRHCACAEFAPSYNYLVGDLCSPDDGNTFVWKADPIWSFDRCYPGPGHQGGTDTSPFSDVDFCFLKCSNTPYATMFFDGPATEGFCTCYDNTDQWSGETPSNCSFGNLYVYTIYSSPSGFVKRQNMIGENQRKTFCPAGLTACNLPQLGQEGYECVDTDMDPESCGGCIHGEYETHPHSAGADCTALLGKSITGVICDKGKWVASTCETGYRLQEYTRFNIDDRKHGPEGHLLTVLHFRALRSPERSATWESVSSANNQSPAHCRCADNDQTWVNQPVTGCNNPGAWVPYRQIVPPTSSAAVIRKRKDDQDRLNLEGLSQRCSQGQRACRVHEGNDEAYECIDTSHELESCGGCVHN